jgi:hypothetical protein
VRRLFADGRAPLIWGVVWGVIQAAAPLGLWWLDGATVYALSIALIAAVYIGFAVADGRPAWPSRPSSRRLSWYSPRRAAPGPRGCSSLASPATG